MDKVKAYTVTGRYYSSREEAEADSYGDSVYEVELKEGEEILENKVVKKPLPMHYKVLIGVEGDIPFWGNFEAARDCTLAINKRVAGPKARLISYVPEKEIKL